MTLVAGCSGTQLLAGEAAGRSAIASAAQRADLLYVSDYETDDVYVYSYATRMRVGLLAGILKHAVYPSGLCSDAQGDVFVPDNGNGSVLEFRHAGTQAIARLSDANEYPYSCAVDPQSGDLAVVNLESFHGGGSVCVYAGARGKPAKYAYPYVFRYFFAAYDDRGDLFVDGAYDAPSLPFVFLELRKGGRALRSVTLEQAFRAPGGVAWDGRALAVGGSTSRAIGRFTIRGSVGKRIGAVELKDAGSLSQFFVAGGELVGARFHGGSADFWAYPNGGLPQKTLAHLGEPFGVTLSRAPH